MNDTVRIGIVGMGNAGMMHCNAILEKSVPRATLAAVCDTKDRLTKLKETLPEATQLFDNYDEMLASDACEAVIVATPHFQHPELSSKALKAGKHVFCEKPAGVVAADVRALNAVAATAGKVFTMHFNRRVDPFVLKLRELIQSGEAGKLVRMNWTVTNWFRSDSYYASAPWRGTWAGEGGGVLINQCIHDLDCWQFLFGMPKRIRAFCRFGKHHEIEVEDEVTAYFEHDNGLNGVFIASTGESPGTSRLEIACSRGKIVVENRIITFHRTVIPVDEFNRANKTGFGDPECWNCEVPVRGKTDMASALLNNFTEAVLGISPLLVKGEEGLASLEIENAILLSSWTDDWAEVPVDVAAFDRELKKRIATSTKKVTGPAQVFDLKKSFK